MSRTSFSIRRLIRRPNDLDNSDSDTASITSFDGVGKLKGYEGYPRASSVPRNSSKKPIPKPIVILKRSSSVHRISGVPPLPDSPPHSSEGPLCSYEHHEPSPTRSGFRSPGLYSMKTKGSELTPPNSSSSLSHNGSPPRSSHIAHHMRMRSGSNPRRDLSVSPANSFESLVIPTDITTTKKSPKISTRQASPRRLEGQSHDQVPGNVQQLIQEVDQAFEAVGAALAEAKHASRSAESPISPTFTRPRRAPAPQGVAPATIPLITRSTSRGKAMKKTPNKPVGPTSPSKGPQRKASVNKAKRRKSKKGKRREQQQLGPPPGPKTAGSRWALSENVSNILNGSIFTRIEADELVTELQIEQTRHNRLSSMEAKRESHQTVDSSESQCETPIDAFHLQDLPTRISQAKLSVPSPIEEVPTPRSFDFGLPPSPPTKNSPPTIKIQSPPLPPPPPTNASSSLLKPSVKPTIGRLRAPPNLATIPEIMVTPIDPPLPASKSFHDFIYFQSPPFSLTTSTIRHGPIRFAKSDLEPPTNPRQVADDTVDLDWTAFQMAILGGAGDLFSDSTDISTSHEAEDADDLLAWMADMGLDSPGGLLSCVEQENEARARREPQVEEEKAQPPPTPEMKQVFKPVTPPPTFTPAPEYSPPSDAANTTPTNAHQPEMIQISSLPMPILDGLRRQTPSPSFGMLGSPLFDGSRGLGLQSRFAASGGLTTDRRAMMRFQNRGRQGSEDSLPQSPMLDLVVNRGTDGEEYVVPMGYNLDHDLKDFLGWEAANVYNGGMSLD